MARARKLFPNTVQKTRGCPFDGIYSPGGGMQGSGVCASGLKMHLVKVCLHKERVGGKLDIPAAAGQCAELLPGVPPAVLPAAQTGAASAGGSSPMARAARGERQLPNPPARYTASTSPASNPAICSKAAIPAATAALAICSCRMSPWVR